MTDVPNIWIVAIIGYTIGTVIAAIMIYIYITPTILGNNI